MAVQCSTSPVRPPARPAPGAERDDALGYGRRVSSVARVAALLACGVLAAIGTTGCSSGGGHASAFCTAIRQPNVAFNTLSGSHVEQALDAFDTVAAKAPAAVAADLHTVSSFQRLLRGNPSAIQKDPALITRYGAATKRVDAYLHDACGVRIPPFGKLY